MFPTIRQNVAINAWDTKALNEVANAAIVALERLHNLDIAVKRVTSPLQYRDDMRLYEGAV